MEEYMLGREQEPIEQINYKLEKTYFCVTKLLVSQQFSFWIVKIYELISQFYITVNLFGLWIVEKYK